MSLLGPVHFLQGILSFERDASFNDQFRGKGRRDLQHGVRQHLLQGGPHHEGQRSARTLVVAGT